MRIEDKIIVEFQQSKELPVCQDITFEINLFNHLYKDDVIDKIEEQYTDLIQMKNVENNYMMIYGHKGAGKTFFIKNILPRIFNNIDIEYIDMNQLLMTSNYLNDMNMVIKYLGSIFLNNFESNKKKMYVFDHIEWVLPKNDSSEIIPASKKIKQHQLLVFFTNLIDSKKYWLLFAGRHYQSINSELWFVSRVDNFIQIQTPDFKIRKKAFQFIIQQLNYSAVSNILYSIKANLLFV